LFFIINNAIYLIGECARGVFCTRLTVSCRANLRVGEQRASKIIQIPTSAAVEAFFIARMAVIRRSQCGFWQMRGTSPAHRRFDMTYNFSRNFAGRISVERAALFVA